MKSYKSLLFLCLVPALALTSCYHEFPSGGGGGGGGNNNGNAFLNVFITSTPSTTFTFPSLYWQISEIDMVNSAGTQITLASGGLPLSDFARLQTDSLYAGHVTIGATSYTTLKVQLNTPIAGFFYNNTNATLLGCAALTVCQIPNTVAGFNAATITVPITYTATANSNTGIRVNFDFSKAVTTAGGMTFDFTKTGAITVIPLPVASSQSLGIDTFESLTGTVSSVSGSTIKVGSFSSDTRTITVAANAEFDDPFAVCTGQASLTCLATGQNVSLNGYVLASDGSLNATEVEFLDRAPLASEVEGVIISPIANNQFQIVMTNGMGPSFTIVGFPVTVTLNNAMSFVVDPTNLGIATSTLGFQSQSDLVLGQQVMIQGGTLSNTGTLTNSTRILLRASSIPGTILTPSGTTFTLSSVSPFFVNLVNNSALVQTFTNTSYDGVTSFAGLAANANASVRGLYLNPNSGATQPILAQKVRTP